MHCRIAQQHEKCKKENRPNNNIIGISSLPNSKCLMTLLLHKKIKRKDDDDSRSTQ